VIEAVSVAAGVLDAVEAEEEALEVGEQGLEALTEEGYEERDYERETGVA